MDRTIALSDPFLGIQDHRIRKIDPHAALCHTILRVFATCLGLYLILCPVSASANPFHAAGHYVAHHKYLLTIDAITVGSAAVESYTSVQCLRDMRLAGVTTSTCTKRGWLSLEVSPAFVFANHAAYHYAPTPETRYIQTMWLGPLTTFEIDSAINNIRISDVGYLKQAWGGPRL